MQSIKAHVYNSESEALQAIEIINKGEGIPVSENAVTRTYTTVQQYEDVWYITADEITKKYLGEPTEIEIINTFDE